MITNPYTNFLSLSIRSALSSLNPFRRILFRPQSVPYSAPFRPIPLTKHACRHLMLIFSQSDNFEAVLRVLRLMKERNCRPDVFCYTLLIKIYSCHLSQFESAFAVLNLMLDQGCEPNVVTYSTLITGLCKEGRINDALNVFDEMLQRKVVPNKYTFASIMRAYCSEGNVHLVKGMIELMQRHGCQPDVVNYNILVYGLCIIRDFDQVERVISASKDNGWDPDEITYSTYIAGLCYAGKAEKAFCQLNYMIQKGLKPTCMGLNILLEGIGREINVSTSRVLLETCGELGFDVDTINYSTVMSQLSKMGRWVGVLNVFLDLFKKGLKPDTYTFNILIFSLCKAGEFGMVRSVFEFEEFVPDAVTCDIVLRAFYTSGEVRELGFALGYLDGKGHIAPNMNLYCTIIDCLCKSGRIPKAVNFVRNIENGYPTDPVSRLTYWLVRMGRIGDVLMLVEEMLEKGLVLEGQTFNLLITAFCQKGFCGTTEMSKVELLLDRMLGIGSV